MDISDIDSYAVSLVGITKPNIPKNFDLLSLNHTAVFDEYFIFALSKSNCVAGSRRIRIIFRNGRNIQDIIDTHNSMVQQLVCSVPFVENTELFYKEIFKGKENDTNVQP